MFKWIPCKFWAETCPLSLPCSGTLKQQRASSSPVPAVRRNNSANAKLTCSVWTETWSPTHTHMWRSVPAAPWSALGRLVAGGEALRGSNMGLKTFFYVTHIFDGNCLWWKYLSLHQLKTCNLLWFCLVCITITLQQQQLGVADKKRIKKSIFLTGKKCR